MSRKRKQQYSPDVLKLEPDGVLVVQAPDGYLWNIRPAQNGRLFVTRHEKYEVEPEETVPQVVELVDEEVPQEEVVE